MKNLNLEIAILDLALFIETHCKYSKTPSESIYQRTAHNLYSKDFSNFFHNATPKEKKKVFKKAILGANKDQRDLMKKIK